MKKIMTYLFLQFTFLLLVTGCATFVEQDQSDQKGEIMSEDQSGEIMSEDQSDQKGEIMGEKQIGTVTAYHTNPEIAAILLTENLKIGDTIHFKGEVTDFTEKVASMGYELEAVNEGTEGQVVGVPVSQEVREGDKVYKAG